MTVNDNNHYFVDNYAETVGHSYNKTASERRPIRVGRMDSAHDNRRHVRRLTDRYGSVGFAAQVRVSQVVLVVVGGDGRPSQENQSQFNGYH